MVTTVPMIIRARHPPNAEIAVIMRRNARMQAHWAGYELVPMDCGLPVSTIVMSLTPVAETFAALAESARNDVTERHRRFVAKVLPG